MDNSGGILTLGLSLVRHRNLGVARATHESSIVRSASDEGGAAAINAGRHFSARSRTIGGNIVEPARGS